MNDTCGKALNDTLSFIDNSTSTIYRCNLIDSLYNQSPYQEFQLKGYKDFYMKMAGYVQLIVNLGISVESTYQTLLQDKPDQYVEVQKMYGPTIQ